MGDLILEVAVVVLPTLFAVVIEVASKEIKQHPLWRIAVVAFGLVLSGLTWLQIARANQTHTAEQEDLEAKLNQSLLNQQYTKGQLDSLSLMVGRLGQPSPQGAELTAAIKQMARATAQNAADLKASNTDLCKRARANADDIRVFQEKYDNDQSLAEEQDLDQVNSAATAEQRRKLFGDLEIRRTNAMQAHEAQFRNKYMPEARYVRDLLLDRVPPKTAEILRQNNNQADFNLTYSALEGAFNEYGIATYLDELAKAVCPPSGEQLNKEHAMYRAVVARLHGFELEGAKFAERCAEGSKDPPPPSQVERWINEADRYVRSTAINESLKTDFELQGPGWNKNFLNVAPGCANLTGKIMTKKNAISSLAHYLNSGK